jgi:hypothetical protein
MIKFLKTVLLYLLMASLPLGATAAVIGSCEPAHAVCKLAQAESCVESAHSEPASDSDSATDQSHDQAGCGGCHAGTAAVAPTLVRGSAGAETMLAFHSTAFAEFVPPALERPPR